MKLKLENVSLSYVYCIIVRSFLKYEYFVCFVSKGSVALHVSV